MLIICSLFESDAGVGIPTPILRLFLAVHQDTVLGTTRSSKLLTGYDTRIADMLLVFTAAENMRT